jgi:Zn-dependent protease/predicted transcriptional regulator
MSWSLRVATVRGIAIKVHLTFLLIVGLGALEWGATHGRLGALFGAFVVCCLFVCVALHELGHSIVAQELGVSVKEIMLLPIGGVARLSREPKTPLHELLISVAGPLVNVVIAIALALFGWVWLGGAFFTTGQVFQSLLAPPSLTALFSTLLLANIGLAVFNMIPALPMDGGRVFRALLSFVLSKARATQIAAMVGQALALGFAALGIFGRNPVWIAIGIFVFLGAAQERSASKLMAALDGLTAGDAVDPRALVLQPGDVLGAVMQHALRSSQSHFAVVLGEQVVGTVSREAILMGVRRQGPQIYVASIMQRDVESIRSDVPLTEVRTRLMERGGAPFVVTAHDGIIGLLGFEDIARAASMADVLTRMRTGQSEKREGRVSLF